MSVHPLDSEVRAEIRADLRNQRGPFRQPIVAPHELVSHYGVHRIKITQARYVLREVCVREVQGPSISLFIGHPDPALQALPPKAVHTAFLKARGHPVPVEQEPKPQKAGPQPLTPIRRAKLLADFQARRGPFVRPLVTVPDLVGHYGITEHPAAVLLGRLSFRAQRAQISPAEGVIVIYVVHNDDPRLLTIRPRELLIEYRQARGLAHT